MTTFSFVGLDDILALKVTYPLIVFVFVFVVAFVFEFALVFVFVTVLVFVFVFVILDGYLASSRRCSSQSRSSS